MTKLIKGVYGDNRSITRDFLRMCSRKQLSGYLKFRGKIVPKEPVHVIRLRQMALIDYDSAPDKPVTKDG